MKKVITLHIETPDDEYDFEVMQNGNKYRNILIELDNSLRNFLKYDHTHEFNVELKEPVNQDLYELVEGIREKLYSLLKEEGVTLC